MFNNKQKTNLQLVNLFILKMPSASYLRGLQEMTANIRSSGFVKCYLDEFTTDILANATNGKTSATSAKFVHPDDIIARAVNDQILAKLKEEYVGCKVVYSDSFGFTVDWS
jgi:hypothetical protein